MVQTNSVFQNQHTFGANGCVWVSRLVLDLEEDVATWLDQRRECGDVLFTQLELQSISNASRPLSSPNLKKTIMYTLEELQRHPCQTRGQIPRAAPASAGAHDGA